MRDGKPFDNANIGHYVYNVAWSPDGQDILLNRTNRKQNILEFAACSPETGKCRAIVHEEWPTGWIENRPEMRFLKDGKRFIWESQRNGFKNFYLYDLSGKLIAPLSTLTAHEADNIVLVDEARNLLFYTARDGDNFMKLQLHRVGLDGKGDKRLTDPAFTHTVSASPDGKFFIDVAQTHDTPPVTRLIDSNGAVVSELAKSDTTKFDQLGLKKVEMFTYTAADGKTKLHGLIHFPSNFDPSKKYPALAGVYGGPASAATSERFQTPNALTEYGFLVLQLDSRAVPGMGKRTLDQIYLKLGLRSRWTTWRRASRRSGAARISTRTASGSTGRRTAATAPRWRSCVTPRCSRPPPRRPRRPTGATTTRSTPSATCGSPRRTRKATTRAPR